MDTEFEDYMDINNTDELDDFEFELTAWDAVEDSVAIIFTCVGLLANFVIIYMIARNARMRSKTNIIIMNFAINDALFLVSNLHFLSSLMELVGAEDHISIFYNCILRFTDVGFQFNEALSILILISNTLMKSKRVQVKWLVVGIYTFIVCNFFLHLIHCHYDMFPVLYLFCFALLVLVFGVVLFKEFNNCYKKWYKQDPLTPRTLFRLNIGRIYIGAWFSTFFLYMISDSSLRYFCFTIAQHSFMSSMYILIYIVYADKNFQICLLNMLQCKGAGNYDVDATITFAEEEDSTDGRPDNNQVNINFNAAENQFRAQGQDISTIRVP